jgi:hypothetical protein
MHRFEPPVSLLGRQSARVPTPGAIAPRGDDAILIAGAALPPPARSGYEEV